MQTNHKENEREIITQNVNNDVYISQVEAIEKEAIRYINMSNEIEKIKVELRDPKFAALANKNVQVIEKGEQAQVWKGHS